MFESYSPEDTGKQVSELKMNLPSLHFIHKVMLLYFCVIGICCYIHFVMVNANLIEHNNTV